MTLVVEDGTGVAGADSYISLADATTYHANMANAAWAAVADDPTREALLRQATQYLTSLYRLRWAGVRRTSAQTLDWPRYDVAMPDAPMGYGSLPAFYPYDKVPDEVRHACAELALRAIDAPLLGDLTQNILSEKVEGITTQYDPNSPQYRRFPYIDAMLGPVLRVGAGTARMVRS